MTEVIGVIGGRADWWCHHLAVALARTQCSVLLVDLDVSAHLTERVLGPWQSNQWWRDALPTLAALLESTPQTCEIRDGIQLLAAARRDWSTEERRILEDRLATWLAGQQVDIVLLVLGPEWTLACPKAILLSHLGGGEDGFSRWSGHPSVTPSTEVRYAVVEEPPPFQDELTTGRWLTRSFHRRFRGIEPEPGLTPPADPLCLGVARPADHEWKLLAFDIAPGHHGYGASQGALRATRQAFEQMAARIQRLIGRFEPTQAPIDLVEEGGLFPWRRFCTPEGEEPHVFDGFLGDPEKWGPYPNHLPLAELPEECVVILGDAGTGKSVECERLCHVGNRHRLSLQGLPRGGLASWLDALEPAELVALDAIDQFDGLIGELEPWLRRGVAKKLWLFGSSWRLMDVLVQLLRRHRKVGIYRLAPLRECDVQEAAQERLGPEGADAFLEAIKARGLQALAGHPLSLMELLLPHYQAHQDMHGSPVELYEAAVRRYLTRPSGTFGQDERLETAGALAWAVIARRAPGIAELAPGETDSVSILPGTFAQVFEYPEARVREVLGTALFRRPVAGHWVFVHATVADYLAARYLAERVEAEDVESSFVRRDGEIRYLPGHLQGVALWMGRMSRPIAASLLRTEPSLFLKSRLEADGEEAALLFARLVEQHRAGEISLVSLPLDGLRWPDRTREGLKLLQDPDPELQWVGIKCLTSGEVIALDALKAIAGDDGRSIPQRQAAIKVFLGSGATPADALDLLGRAPAPLRPSLAEFLWPSEGDPIALLDRLEGAEAREAGRVLQRLGEDVVARISAEVLPDVLGRWAAHPGSLWEAGQPLQRALFRFVWMEIARFEVQAALAALLLRAPRTLEGVLPLDPLDESVRRNLIALLVQSGNASHRVEHAVLASGLLEPDDLEFLIDRALAEADAMQCKAWVTLALHFPWSDEARARLAPLKDVGGEVARRLEPHSQPWWSRRVRYRDAPAHDDLLSLIAVASHNPIHWRDIWVLAHGVDFQVQTVEDVSQLPFLTPTLAENVRAIAQSFVSEVEVEESIKFVGDWEAIDPLSRMAAFAALEFAGPRVDNETLRRWAPLVLLQGAWQGGPLFKRCIQLLAGELHHHIASMIEKKAMGSPGPLVEYLLPLWSPVVAQTLSGALDLPQGTWVSEEVLKALLAARSYTPRKWAEDWAAARLDRDWVIDAILRGAPAWGWKQIRPRWAEDDFARALVRRNNYPRQDWLPWHDPALLVEVDLRIERLFPVIRPAPGKMWDPEAVEYKAGQLRASIPGFLIAKGAVEAVQHLVEGLGRPEYARHWIADARRNSLAQAPRPSLKEVRSLDAPIHTVDDVLDRLERALTRVQHQDVFGEGNDVSVLPLFFERRNEGNRKDRHLWRPKLETDACLLVAKLLQRHLPRSAGLVIEPQQAAGKDRPDFMLLIHARETLLRIKVEAKWVGNREVKTAMTDQLARYVAHSEGGFYLVFWPELDLLEKDYVPEGPAEWQRNFVALNEAMQTQARALRAQGHRIRAFVLKLAHRPP